MKAFCTLLAKIGFFGGFLVHDFRNMVLYKDWEENQFLKARKDYEKTTKKKPPKTNFSRRVYTNFQLLMKAHCSHSTKAFPLKNLNN